MLWSCTNANGSSVAKEVALRRMSRWLSESKFMETLVHLR